MTIRQRLDAPGRPGAAPIVARRRRSEPQGDTDPTGPLTLSRVLRLQQTAGNTAVQRLLAADGGPGVQRKLDPARFSKAGFRGAGLKPGARLSGQSRFADLEGALADYHGAQSRTEELKGLDAIETAADAWLQSSYRTKKHSAAKATEEGQKSAEVNALLNEVRREREDILSTIDPATAGALGQDQAHNASIATLARTLGVTRDQLKAMTPDALKALYVAQVLEPFYIARKAGAQTGMAGNVVDLMFHLGNADLDKLPDGDTKTIIALVKQSSINDRNALMHEPAPKYARGGVSTEEVAPNVPGWADTSRLAITGGDDFRSKVRAMIPQIAGTAVGQKLLAALGGEPDLEATAHPRTKQVVAEIKLPKVTHFASVTAGGDPRYGNSAGRAGGKGFVSFDPESDILGKPEQVAAEPWRQREPVIALFHELIHVLIASKDGEDWFQGKEQLHLTHDDEKAEVRITGINYKVQKADGSGEVEFPFSNPTYNPITENEFRKQLAASQGKQSFLPRPTYATVAGQVPLQGGPMPTT
jgi:hypothetical protein